MRIPTLIALLIFSVATFSFSQNPEKSVAPPGMIFELLALNKDLPTNARPKYLSPCAMASSPDSHYLYVAEQTAKQIDVVDLKTNSVVKSIKLPNEPTGITVSPDGVKLYAACSSDLWPSGMVCEVDAAAGRVTRCIPAGHGARSPVISHSGKTLFICNQYENTVSIIDVQSGRERARIPSAREPFTAAITPDDSVLVVGDFLPTEISRDTMKIASKITLIDVFARKLLDTISLPAGSHSVSGVAVSPDGKYAFATHMISIFNIMAVRIEKGWVHTNDCAIIDLKGRKIINVAALDDTSGGKADPWGIGCTQDGKFLCITHSGSNELSVIDLPKLVTLAQTSNFSPTPITQLYSDINTLSRKFSALKDIKLNVLVQEKSPRAMSIIGNNAYVAGYFGNKVEIFSLNEMNTAAIGTIVLESVQPSTSQRKGEQAFFDGRLCYQKWQTCHSCHPFTRSDGLSHVDRSDCCEAPKKTKSILYAWWTPPTSWGGFQQNAYESIRAGMIIEFFIDPDLEVAKGIDTFAMNLKSVPSPFLVKGKLSAAASKGREIYNGNKANCAQCHPSSLYTDMKFHNAGINDPYDNNLDWNTPSLVEAWRTGPYGHLGSLSTIRDILDLPGMGSVSTKLTQEEIDQLTAFVLSL
jgi:YVTN family beta-propeller protein